MDVVVLAHHLVTTLDLLPQPLVLALPGPPLRLVHTNAAARERLSSSPLLPVHDGVLLPPGEANANELGRVVERALAAGPRCPQKAVLTGPDGSTRTLQLQVLDCAGPGLPAPVLLLEIQERAPPAHGVERLRTRFGLTCKEAECALGLYSLGSVDRFARCTGKSVHTVRTQLKLAMQKTATNTQAALVALVANLLNE